MQNDVDKSALPSALENDQGVYRVRALKRFTHENKGYDCKHAPCEHNPPGNHGISGGSWLFALAMEDHAVSLRVCTSFYPDSVPVAHRVSGWPRVKKGITGILVFHRGVAEGGEDCDFLGEGRRCETEIGGYLICDEFAPLLAETMEPQSDAFWKKLEDLLDQWVRVRDSAAQGAEPISGESI